MQSKAVITKLRSFKIHKQIYKAVLHACNPRFWEADAGAEQSSLAT